MKLPSRLFALVFSVAIALPIASCSNTALVSATDTVTKSVDAGLLHPGMLVRIEVFNGDITVTPSTDGAVSATITRKGTGTSDQAAREALDKIQVTSGITTSEAFVRAIWAPEPGSPGNHGATAVVAIPPGSAAILRTSNGTVRATGIAGPLNIHSSNGPVRVEGATQGVSVDTSNAEVVAQGVGGLMSLTNANGAITIADAVGARLDVKTSNAAVAFTGSLGAGTSIIENANGEVTVRIPAASSFAFAIETSNASVSVAGFAAAAVSGRPSAAGEIGVAPATHLDVHTSNKAVTVTGIP